VITGARLKRRVVAVGAGAIVLLLIVGTSAAPLPFHDPAMARLRLSWSARPERIEVCRTVSAEELEQREEHMRQRVECDGRFATYTLRVEADDRVVSESIVRGAGLRHDRPLYVLRDFDLPPGVHRIRVTFTRREKTDDDAAAFAKVTPAVRDSGIFVGRAEREAEEHARRARAAIPASLALDTSVTFTRRRVKIITFDRDRRALEVLDDTRASR
jgi:hypothetical protein